MKTPAYREPTAKQQKLLKNIRVRPLRAEETNRAQRLLEKHHYLGGIKAVGERQWYVAVTPNGGWMAVLLFCAACKHLKGRDEHIGWTVEQRRRRLSLVVNNARFLLRRLAVSLFIEWRSRDATRKWCTMTDFYADMRKNNQRRGFLLVTSKQCMQLGWKE